MNYELYCGLSGRIVTPCDDSYQEDRQGWNHAIQKYPLVINYCYTASDVSCAVLWARQNNAAVRIRNGGHNYEGYSNGNCILVIDVSEMKEIEFDDKLCTVRAQGGVNNHELYEFVSSRGYPFPGGTCPTVGVCGYALGGGWGLSCRYFGLGCDSIEEIEMVDYQGHILKVNRLCNSELFWALRGAGGGNFGVVVSITFRLPPPVSNVTLIEIDYSCADYKTQELFLYIWQEWLSCADERMTLISRIYNSETDGLSMLVRGIFYGRQDEAGKLLKSFLDIQGAIPNIEYMSFLEAVTIIGSTYPEFERFQSASRFVYRRFNRKEIKSIVKLIQQRPHGSVYTGLSMYALGGKVAKINEDETAFLYRDAHYIIWLETIWEDNCFAHINSEWINRQFQRLMPLTVGSYVNFPYSELPEYLNEYYGNHLSRLEKIKKKYDPCNVFTFPQALRTRGCDESKQDRVADNLIGYDENKLREETHSKQRNYRKFRYITQKPE